MAWSSQTEERRWKRGNALRQRQKAQEQEADARKSEADAQKREVLIAQMADRRPRQVGKIARPKVRRFRGPLTRGRDQAQVQESLALKATQTANEQRDRALLQESRALTIFAQDASKAGDQPTAMLLALRRFRIRDLAASDRSLPAAAALHQAWLRKRE